MRFHHRNSTSAISRMTAMPAQPPTTPPAIVPAGGVSPSVPPPPPPAAAEDVLLTDPCVGVAGACPVSVGPLTKLTDVLVCGCCVDLSSSENTFIVRVVVLVGLLLSSSSLLWLDGIGEIVDTRPSANVVVYGWSDLVIVATSPLESVAKNIPGPRDARLPVDDTDRPDDDRVVSTERVSITMIR